MTTLTSHRTADVVFLHGSASSGQMWRRYADRLVGRRVVAPDLIGYGRARAWPAGARLGLDDEVARLRELIATHDPIHLVGYSYGGAVARAFAAQDPAAVASLTLIEPVAFFVLRYARDAAAYAEAAWVGDAFFGDLARGQVEAALRSFFEYWMVPFTHESQLSDAMLDHWRRP